MTHTLIRPAAVPLALLLAATLAPAQVSPTKEPPRAEKLDVQIRYRIRADRDERIRQYRAMTKYFASLGFVDAKKDDPDHELDILDPNADRLTGTVPSANVMDLLRDPRVQNILFAPAGFMYPEPDRPVAVKIGLRTGYVPTVQQELHRQTVIHLGLLGFRESLGYDTRGYRIVRGSIPQKNLDLLVKDVRAEPSGWFLSVIPTDRLPAPLRDANPIRWAEVLPVAEFPPAFAPAPLLPGQLRLSADLRAALLNPATKGAPLRVEVLFEDRVADVAALRARIAGRYVGASLDGVVGNVASVRLPQPEVAQLIAAEPGVLGVRLPRQAEETVALAADGKGIPPAEVLAATNVNELHKLRYKGAGVKVVLIGSDFSGAERLIGTELPKRTRIVDLTIELTPELVPAKADPTRLGTGTAAARALALAAPECELVLVRIDPGCYFHLLTAIRLARGELTYTDALEVRLAELSTRSIALDRDRAAAIGAYRTAFADLSDNPVAAAARKRARAELDAVLAREKELVAVVQRFNAYQKEISTALLGARVFVNTLVWESGYPLDGLNELAATLDRLAAAPQPRITKPVVYAQDSPKPPLVWVQAGSAAGAAAWGGPFLDANRDGRMEFVPPGAPLAPGDWSRQLNFLGTRTPTGDVTPELAAGTRLRFAVQWREPADPNFPETDTPAYPLTLRLLRQIDPAGAQRSSDEMQEEARSASVPNVIFRTRTYLVFEQMLEYTVPAPGRYALILESAPTPEPLLPALRREVEIHPRLVVETPGTAAGEAKVVFRSYTTTAAGVGIPGDAQGAITVGVEGDREQVGAGTGVALRVKPDVFGPPSLALGNQSYRGQGTATAFAGGTAALLAQARFSGANVFRSAGIEEGKKLIIPERWFRPVPQPRTKP